MYPAELRYDLLFMCDPDDEETALIIGESFEQIVRMEWDAKSVGLEGLKIGDTSGS